MDKLEIEYVSIDSIKPYYQALGRIYREES